MKTLREWAGIAAFFGLIITALSMGAAIGRASEQLEQKADRVTIETRLGRMEGDIRVIKSVVCADKPGACQ
jgi:hypothetical protein